MKPFGFSARRPNLFLIKSHRCMWEADKKTVTVRLPFGPVTHPAADTEAAKLVAQLLITLNHAAGHKAVQAICEKRTLEVSQRPEPCPVCGRDHPSQWPTGEAVVCDGEAGAELWDHGVPGDNG